MGGIVLTFPRPHKYRGWDEDSKTHFCDLSTRVPCVDVKHAAGEAAELVVAIKDLNRIAPLNALPLQVRKFASPDVVSASVRITPAGPVIKSWKIRWSWKILSVRV